MSSVCAIVIGIVGAYSGKSAMAVLFFFAAVQWSVLVKCESDLRLLRAIERLHVGGNDKATPV